MSTFALVTAFLIASPAATAPPSAESLSAAAVRIAGEIARNEPQLSQPRADGAWDKVRRLPDGSRIRVMLRDGGFKEGRLSEVADDRIVLVSAGFTEIRRDAITEIKRPSRARALAGGILGTAAGGALGLFSAVGLAFKNCGGDCSDEKLLMGASLVGMPIAGGYLGARVAPWTTVYRRR